VTLSFARAIETQTKSSAAITKAITGALHRSEGSWTSMKVGRSGKTRISTDPGKG